MAPAPFRGGSSEAVEWRAAPAYAATPQGPPSARQPLGGDAADSGAGVPCHQSYPEPSRQTVTYFTPAEADEAEDKNRAHDGEDAETDASRHDFEPGPRSGGGQKVTDGQGRATPYCCDPPKEAALGAPALGGAADYRAGVSCRDSYPEASQ
jgi:hypothetical protein